MTTKMNHEFQGGSLDQLTMKKGNWVDAFVPEIKVSTLKKM
jgi:hypothetical protein